MKKILVLPVKNEEWILDKSMSCASLWADHIIVAYQESSDRTLEILKKFPKVIIVENKSTVHSSNVRKLLFDSARQFEGNNVIFSLDADEIASSNILSEDFNRTLEELPIGAAIEMQWVNLWRSPLNYRDDSSVWSNSWKHFAFKDDRNMDYTSLGVINDHTNRVPIASVKNTHRLNNPKILHYQYVDWQRVLSKQAYYRLSEWQQREKSLKEVLKINYRYFFSKDETGLLTKPIPQEWIKIFVDSGIDLNNFPVNSVTWFDMEVLKCFLQYGQLAFKNLDIWDINWEEKRQLALQQGLKNLPQNEIIDPRSFVQVWYHNHQHFLQKVFAFLAPFIR